LQSYNLNCEDGVGDGSLPLTARETVKEFNVAVCGYWRCVIHICQ